MAGQPQLAAREMAGSRRETALPGAVADVAEDVEDAKRLAVLERARLGIEPGFGDDVIGIWCIGHGLHAVRASTRPRVDSHSRL